MRKVIIAGSREVPSLQRVFKVLNDLPRGFKPDEVVCGCAKGVDSIGRCWAEGLGIPVKKFPAPWKEVEGKPESQIGENSYGKYWKLAGFDRNAKMAEYADALILIWDGESNGSGHMLEMARHHNLKIHNVII